MRDPEQANGDDDQRQGVSVFARSCQPSVSFTGAEHAVGFGLHLCLGLRWVRLFRVRDRCLRPRHRELAGQQESACQIRARCGRAGDP